MNNSSVSFVNRPLIVFSLLGILIVGLSFIYGNLILKDPILGYDDHTLVLPLMRVRSLWSYRPFIDMQPVRDLSYLWDISLERSWDISAFHLSNVLIWASTCMVIYFLLLDLGHAILSAFFLTLLVAFHPVFVDSVAWIAARKHLLAAFFTLFNTLLFVKISKRNDLGVGSALLLSLIYALSVFSQPITLLWPFWALTWTLSQAKMKWTGEELRNGLKRLFPCFVVMLSATAINLYYYLFLKYAGGPGPIGTHPKFMGFAPKVLLQALFAFGRYFFNFILPINYSIIYRTNSWQNNLGLISFAIWIWLVIKKLPRKVSLPWLTFYFLHLALVTVNMTQIFTSDTYILTSSIALFHLTYLLFSGWWNSLERILGTRAIKVTLAVGFLIMMIFVSRETARPWEDTLSLYRNAFEQEPTKWTKTLFAIALMDEPDRGFSPREALRLVNEVGNEHLSKRFALRIMYKGDMDAREKVQWISLVAALPDMDAILKSLSMPVK